MSAVTYSTVIEKFFTEIDLLLKNYVYAGYHTLAKTLQYPLSLAATIYIVFLGISIAQGWVQLSMGNLVKSTLKISLALTFALNWSFFSEFFASLITKGAGQIGSILIHASPIHIPRIGNQGIKGALQMSLIEYTKIGGLIWDQGSLHDWSPYFVGLCYWFFGIGMVVLGVFELTEAIIMLSILLVLAPLFVGFTLFKSTHSLFDRWLGANVGYGLQLIFISASLAVVLSLSQWCIGGYEVGSITHIHLSSFVPITMVGFICMGILKKSANQAQAIGSNITTASSSGLVAGAIGGMLGASMRSLYISRAIIGGLKNMLSGVKKLTPNGLTSAFDSRMKSTKNQMRQSSK